VVAQPVVARTGKLSHTSVILVTLASCATTPPAGRSDLRRAALRKRSKQTEPCAPNARAVEVFIALMSIATVPQDLGRATILGIRDKSLQINRVQMPDLVEALVGNVQYESKGRRASVSQQTAASPACSAWLANAVAMREIANTFQAGRADFRAPQRTPVR